MRVCVVEDDPALAELTRLRLALCGVEATIYYDAAVALPAILAKGADIVICDVELPHVGGLVIAQALLDSLASCRFILMSGSPLSLAGEKLISRYKKRCVFLKKPFVMEQLVSTLESLFSQD